MSSANALQIKAVIVTGRTTWDAQEYRTLGRFRHGSQTKLCAVKDEQGKPAQRAAREIRICIVCSDGVSYRFDHEAHMPRQYDPSRAIRVHGQWYSVSTYDTLPPAIVALHASTARRIRACLRIMRAEVAALPVFRPLPVAVKG